MIAAAILLGVTAMAAPASSVQPSATVVSVPAAAPVSATAVVVPVAPPASATVTAAPVSSTVAAVPEGWSAPDLARLRCVHARHVQQRDQGWTFSSWLDPMKCGDRTWSPDAQAAWDRYEKRARRYDDCVTSRRVRKPRAFIQGFIGGGLVTFAAFGIARSGSDTVRLTAAASTAVVGGGLLWWLERRKPDPPCGAEPATEWPR